MPRVACPPIFSTALDVYGQRGSQFAAIEQGQSAPSKDAYVEKMEAQMQEWHAKIRRLKEKAEQEEAAVKLKYSEQMEGLRAKQAAAQQTLRDFKFSSESAWEELKIGGITRAACWARSS